jgi:hypothetical protein
MNPHVVAPPPPRSSPSANGSKPLRTLAALALAAGTASAAGLVACASSETSRPAVLGDCGDARCLPERASGSGPGPFNDNAGPDGGSRDATPLPEGTSLDAARVTLFPPDAPVGNALIPISDGG